VLTLVFAASALTCLILSVLFILYLKPVNDTAVESNDFKELLNVIDRRFIGTFDIDDITDAAMRAAVSSLDDDWSYYMSADEYADYLATANNRYTGIGVEVSTDETTNGMRVLSVYNDSGADLAGIIIDDIITAIDGESILGLTLQEIRSMLRRPLGDTAILTVKRVNVDGFLELTVIYDTVFRNPVKFEMFDNNVGYVRLLNFEENAADRFLFAVRELIRQGAEAFIYDVRNNNGGRVGEVTEILDFLLPEGEIFISVDRTGIESITKSNADFIDLPAVVLVNSYSFSGAEFFAAMLDEYDYAVTIGDQTTGKNRMQTTIPLSNGRAVHISTGHYLTKNRISLFDTGGYTPNILLPLTDDERILFNRGELEFSADPQIQKALSLLEN